ncbi:helix-turn-helix domain-containing protein [Tropicibacter naphthalenivorans]|uniref:Helix-turn-helix domain protein n=1 Tax=Tropicibacter naphthalenivorans TaxID=441103 RepID=A0A0P1G4K4_9RHOB|nr:helix-turn-helix transcriptional regulator [Tropicibacter naphthalenivorans]CUH76619.1 Helix-turn-helix domain protein [Tropicibacter naphthalenivorans]SMC64525.1 hypothetical protein SAMN04488093_102587 [Tropicibacter naphthalenivorans]
MTVARLFGQNLRKLCERRPSIAAVARDLDVNKVQFNRYLNGESYPKPQLLKEICAYFGTDARIMTEPLEEVEAQRAQQVVGVALDGPRVAPQFAPGLYSTTIVSPRLPKFAVRQIRQIKRSGPLWISKSYMARGIAARLLGRVPRLSERQNFGELRGVAEGSYVLTYPNWSGGVYFEFYPRNSMTSYGPWPGLLTFGSLEITGRTRAVRSVMQHLDGLPAAISCARTCGYVPLAELTEYERDVLRPGEPFT